MVVAQGANSVDGCGQGFERRRPFRPREVFLHLFVRGGIIHDHTAEIDALIFGSQANWRCHVEKLVCLQVLNPFLPEGGWPRTEQGLVLKVDGVEPVNNRAWRTSRQDMYVVKRRFRSVFLLLFSLDLCWRWRRQILPSPPLSSVCRLAVSGLVCWLGYFFKKVLLRVKNIESMLSICRWTKSRNSPPCRLWEERWGVRKIFNQQPIFGLKNEQRRRQSIECGIFSTERPLPYAFVVIAATKYGTRQRHHGGMHVTSYRCTILP